jgi:MFS family permease
VNIPANFSPFIRNSLRALNSRNYRLFFIGQGISLIGSWMQRVAMGWLVYRLTNSAMLLGTVGFTDMILTFLLAPFTGVLADRWDRHKIMIGTQTFSMLHALILGFLVVSNLIQVWHIIALSLCMGVITAFDVPARQSFVIDMVEDKKDLGNAIALNSTMFNSARLIGPSIAGLVIAAAGEWVCFFLNAVSFFAVIWALLAMKLKQRVGNGLRKRALVELREGFLYTYRNLPIRAILLLMAFVSVVGMSYMTLLPVFARDVLHGGPDTLGFLMASIAIGGVGAAFYLASRRETLTIGRQIPAALALLGLGLLAFGSSRNMWFSFVIVMCTGFGQMVMIATSNTVIQTIVEEDKRGRVMSFYTMAFMGMAPFGSLLAGASAKLLGAPNAVVVGGALCLMGAASFALRLPFLQRASVKEDD